MKYKLCPLLFMFLFISSCATQLESRNLASEEAVKIEEDYNWIDNLNFDKKTTVEDKKDADVIAPRMSDISTERTISKEIVETKSVLLPEALQVLSIPELINLETDLKDNELTKISVKCLQSKFEEAFLLVDKLYDQKKNSAMYWNQVASCYFFKNDYSKAILFFNKARDIDSKYAVPLNNLGVVFQRQGRFQKAHAAFKKASDMNTFLITPTYNLAKLYLKFGIVSKAMPLIDGLLKKNPGDSSLKVAKAYALLLNGDEKMALDGFALFSLEELSKVENALTYSLVLKLNNKDEEAKKIFSEIKPVNDASFELKNYYAQIELKLKNEGVSK